MARTFSGRAGMARLMIVLSLVTFVLCHQLIYLAAYGAQTAVALAQTGHDVQWNLTLVTALALAVSLVGMAIRELRRLSREAHQAGWVADDPHLFGPLHLLRDAAALWLPTASGAVVLFVLWENAERLAAGFAPPALDVLRLAPAGATIAIFWLTAAVVALVAALYRWRRGQLEARIAAMRRHWGRPTSSPLPRVDRRPPALFGARVTPPGRAPPVSVPV